VAEERPRGFKAQVKGPLLVAAALAVAAFFAVFIFATGGTRNHPNLVLALGVAGAVFVVTLVVCATLILAERPNDPSLGQGTGINKSSAKLYEQAKAKREAAEREKAREQENSQATGTKETTAGNNAEPPKTTDS